MQRIMWCMLVLGMIVLSACNTESEKTQRWVIASEMGDCVGVAPMKCLLVKKEGQQDWEFFYTRIEGFDFESGYEYEIEVKEHAIENPAADQSSIRYILVKQLSKEEKTSENLPVIPIRQNTFEGS